MTLVAGSTTSEVFGALKPPAEYNLGAIDSYISEFVREQHLPGMSVAIMKDGKVVLAKGYGQRSLEDGLPVEKDTMFAIGSVSKQFACACILLLAEDGQLSVHDKVAKYYPDLTRADDITLLDLMNHVSGYPDYYPLDFVDRRMRKEIEPDELLRQYGGAKLDFEPGSRYSYSNTGFVLLGRVVEKVSGLSYGEFLSKRILQPLGLRHTAYEPELSGNPFARGYTTFALSGPEYVAPEAKGWVCAAGAMYSTPSDMMKWDLALMTGKVLKPESFELMIQPRKLNDGRMTEYGCGIGVRMQGGRQMLSHNGAVAGFVTWSAMIPSMKSAVVVMCNQDGGYGTLPADIFALLLKEPVPSVPAVKGPNAADAARKSFTEIQRGRVDRRKFSEDFNIYLTDEKVAGAAKRLKHYGTVTGAEVLNSHERGGMEVTTTRLTFKKGALKALMYRKPDGQIEQFFVYPE